MQHALGERESIADVARSLSRGCRESLRVYFRRRLSTPWRRMRAFQSSTRCPISTSLQTFADFFTLGRKIRSTPGVRLAYIGDRQQRVPSLMIAGSRMGAHVRIATPAGYEPDAKILEAARRDAASTQGTIELFREPQEAISRRGKRLHRRLASMARKARRRRAAIFAPYQVNAALMSHAAPMLFSSTVFPRIAARKSPTR